MSTNVFCDFCEKEFEKNANDSFIVEGEIVRAYHFECGRLIVDAFKSSRGVESQPAEPADTSVLARRVDRVEAVWKLWITEAEKGSISQATFHTMKHLLGMDKA